MVVNFLVIVNPVPVVPQPGKMSAVNRKMAARITISDKKRRRAELQQKLFSGSLARYA